MLDHLTLINWTVTPIFLDGGPTSSADGIAATLRPVNTGSAEAVYIESSIFNGRTSGSRAAVLEDWDGVRLVYRYNSGVNNWISSHGYGDVYGSDFRGPVVMELYNNTADCSRTDGCYYWATIRGGQAIVTNNTITETGQTWSSTPVMITYYRLGHGMAVDYCVSTDWNVVRCTSYPCEDQPGYVGTTQYPQYIWGNTFTPKFGNPFYKVQTWSGINDGQNCAIAPTAINASGQCNAGSAIGACFVAINRDYYLSAKPGYTPYAYPHPLAVGTPPPDTTPPEPPSGVVII